MSHGGTLVNGKELEKRRSLGGQQGGGVRNDYTNRYFNPMPDMPAVACKNSGKSNYADWCDDVARVGFGTCQGCADKASQSKRKSWYDEHIAKMRVSG